MARDSTRLDKRIPRIDTKIPVKDHVDVNEPVRHLTIPEAAVFVARAAENFGDKVALAGFSVSNFGVFASSDTATGLFARGGGLAAEFEGNVSISGACEITGRLRTRGDLIVDGDIQLAGADYAEDFDTDDAAGAVPGAVMVLGDTGGIRVSDTAYDRRVAGVISGAGGYRPAIILDRRKTHAGRRPLALMGKVWCQVDAREAAVAVGDLLTTSTTPGHAMKAGDAARAFGAVIGKALQPLAAGCGLVPILVALQ